MTVTRGGRARRGRRPRRRAPGTRGCGDSSSAVIDSLPIPLGRAPRGDGMGGHGALLARAAAPDAPASPFPMVIDTGSSITMRAGTGRSPPRGSGFDILDPRRPADPMPRPCARVPRLRRVRPAAAAVGDASVVPEGVLGGDSCAASPSSSASVRAVVRRGGMRHVLALTFWRHQGAELGFLPDAGYAVLRFTLLGGGETTAEGKPTAGPHGPLVLPATRVVLRACAVQPILARPAARACCREARRRRGRRASIWRWCSPPAWARWCSGSRPGRARRPAAERHRRVPTGRAR